MKARIVFEAEVELEIPDDLVPAVVGPPVLNLDDQGQPQPDERGGRGWRNVLYPLDTPEKVVEHLAYNAVFNSVEDIRRLDGWAGVSQENARRIHFSRADVFDTEVFITEGEDSLAPYRRT